MRVLIYIILILSLYFGACVFIGVKFALIAMSLFMLILAITFSAAKDSYIKYLQLVNPKYAAIYNSKDDEFRKKHRLTDIKIFYIFSPILLLLSLSMKNIKFPIQGSSTLYIILPTVLLTVLLWLSSLFILKKSNKNSSFWFYFIALICSAILLFALII